MKFYIDPPLWFIIPVYLLLSIVLYQSLVLFMVGIVIWQISEYTAHRWILHGLYKAHHRVHHIESSHHISLPLPVTSVGAILYLLLLPLACVSGVFTGYVLYEVIHRLNPVWHRKHHVNSKKHFGVTLPI